MDFSYAFGKTGYMVTVKPLVQVSYGKKVSSNTSVLKFSNQYLIAIPPACRALAESFAN